jgi:transposase InsO family protein
MDQILTHGLRRFVLVYIDDIIVYSPSIDSHYNNLRTVLNWLSEAGLILNRAKCTFLATSTTFLGHIISNEGIAVDPAKTKAIADFPTPRSVTHIREFLGLANYYRAFVPNFASLALPLTTLLSPKNPFTWSTTAKDSFQKLKSCLAHAAILRTPNWSKPFTLTTDASNIGLGAILSQNSDGLELPINFLSRCLKGPELNYSATEREALAVVWGVTSCRYYLFGAPFQVITDHKALLWLMTHRDNNSKLMRWSLRLAPYDFTITYRPGIENTAADALSRNPVMTYAIIFDTLTPTPTDITTDPAFRQFLETGKTPNDNQANRFKALRNVYVIRNGNLYHRANGIFPDRPVPPPDTRLQLVHDAHALLNHAGYHAVLRFIEASHYWPNMRTLIKSTVTACAVCDQLARSKLDTRKMSTTAATVLQRIAMDTIGPITPGSNEGHRYILTITDMRSRFAQTYALQDKTATTVANCLQSFILAFGFPQEVLSDNGTEFCNSVIQTLLFQLDINRCLTSPYSPQSNGMIERFNGTLLSRLRKYALASNPESWKQALTYVTFAYNITPHTALKLFSPFEIFFGRPPRLPTSMFTNERPLEYFQALEDLRLLPRRNTMPDTMSLPIGTFVFTRTRTNDKLTPPWIGPRIVVDNKGGGAVETADLSGQNRTIHHRNDLKPVHTDIKIPETITAQEPGG